MKGLYISGPGRQRWRPDIIFIHLGELKAHILALTPDLPCISMQCSYTSRTQTINGHNSIHAIQQLFAAEQKRLCLICVVPLLAHYIGKYNSSASIIPQRKEVSLRCSYIVAIHTIFGAKNQKIRFQRENSYVIFHVFFCFLKSTAEFYARKFKGFVFRAKIQSSVLTSFQLKMSEK